MLLVKDVRLLLLDEPVAGMSHDEREATGRLLRRISEDRTVVVIEHDMDFMRSFARSVSVLHAGKVLSEGSVTEVQADARVQEVYLGRASEPEPGPGRPPSPSPRRRETHAADPVRAGRVRPHHRAARRDRRGAEGRRRGRPRPQRRGQEHPPAHGHGAPPRVRRHGPAGRRGHHPPRPAQTGRPRCGVRAAGTAELPAPHHRGEPPARRRRPPRRPGGRRGGAGPLPGPAGAVRTPGRSPLRRPAPATGHRPRPGHPAPAAAPGRADRGHPAVRRRRDRGDDPRPDPARRPVRPPRRTARRLRHARRPAVLRPGGRTGHVVGRRGAEAEGTVRAALSV